MASNQPPTFYQSEMREVRRKWLIEANMSSPGSGSVYSPTVKPSTRSARSISATSVLKLCRHGDRREPPVGCCPRPPLFRVEKDLQCSAKWRNLIRQEARMETEAIAEVLGGRKVLGKAIKKPDELARLVRKGLPASSVA